MIKANKWVSLVGVVLCLSISQAFANPFQALFPVADIQDADSLQLKIHTREKVKAQHQPDRTLTRIELEFTSFMWEGEVWRHRAYVYLPDRHVEEFQGAGVVVSSARPDDPVYIRYAEASALMGIPALMIRDGNPGPRYGMKTQGEVMGYSDKKFFETGDLRWSGYSLLARVMMRAITAAQQIPEFNAQRFVVTGCSKRGAAAWVSAATDDRVVGAFPTCWNAGNISELLKLKAERFGMDYQPRLVEQHMILSIKNLKMTSAPAFISTREQIKRYLEHPYSERQALIQDPYEFREFLEGKKVLYSNGINDPLFPAVSDTVFGQHMSSDVHIQLVANARHVASSEEQHISWPMFLSHTFAERELTAMTSISSEVEGSELVVKVTLDSPNTIERIRIWYAADKSGSYLDASWQSVPMSALSKGRYVGRVPINSSYVGYFIELYDRDDQALPGVVTSGFQEYHNQ